MRFLLVEGVTDVAFVKYICFKNNITKNFNDFKVQKSKISKIEIYKSTNLNIINIKGQDNLEYTLNKIIKPTIPKIKSLAIIQDADDDYDKSEMNIKIAITNSKIDESKISYFLTPNNKDNGDLETLLLSTIKDNDIVKCFDSYKKCLEEKEDIHQKALNKGQVYAYTMYSQKGENLHKPHNSFIYKKETNYEDTKLWDLEKKEFQPIIKFIKEIFGEDN